MIGYGESRDYGEEDGEEDGEGTGDEGEGGAEEVEEEEEEEFPAGYPGGEESDSPDSLSGLQGGHGQQGGMLGFNPGRGAAGQPRGIPGAGGGQSRGGEGSGLVSSPRQGQAHHPQARPHPHHAQHRKNPFQFQAAGSASFPGPNQGDRTKVRGRGGADGGGDPRWGDPRGGEASLVFETKYKINRGIRQKIKKA